MSLQHINQVTETDAKTLFLQCCTSQRWADKMLVARPFSNAEALSQAADASWQNLAESDYLQAFDGHPKIGDVNSLRAKYANTKALASGEQAAVKNADDAVIEALSAGNNAYCAKFGFIFIVCATGKSAEQMLAMLQQRLANDRATELSIAAEQQRQILQLRLEKLL